MRVLGIDPGLTRCGVGVVEGASAGRSRWSTSNVGAHPRRRARSPAAGAIEKGLDAWIEEHRPDAVAVERVFARSDSSTIMGTAQASGIALVVAARRGLPVALHTPSEVKAAVSGNGRADKAQVGAMVTRILRLDAPPKPADAADALALAITHIWRGGAQARSTPRSAGRPGQEVADDRLRPRRGRRRHPDQRRPRGRRRRARADVHARHPRHAARRPAGDAAHEHGRARGLPDALRLPRRGREAGLRAGADRVAGSAPSSPRRCSRCSRPTTYAVPSRPRTSRR